jgi:hypothetical protein
MHSSPGVFQLKLNLHPGGKEISPLPFQRIPFFPFSTLAVIVGKAQASNPVADGHRPTPLKKIAIHSIILPSE